MQSTEMVTKPSKQRKMVHHAADHVRHRLFAAHLSPELRTSHLVKTFPVRSGDTVRIMRGDHKGSEGKVTRIDKRKYRIYVEGLTREKVDGTTIFVPIHPSKVMITNLNLDDKWRKKILERKKSQQAKTKEIERKPKEKQKARSEGPAEITTQPPVAKEKIMEEQKPEEKKLTLETKPQAEKKRPRKKTAETKKRAARKTTAQETRVESSKPAKEKKSRSEKKKPKRKATNETKGGE
jgi:large subunit ribosomal protein L24